MRMVPASSSPRRATTMGIASIEQRRTAAITCMLVLSRGSIAPPRQREDMAAPQWGSTSAARGRISSDGGSGEETGSHESGRREPTIGGRQLCHREPHGFGDRFGEVLRRATASLLNLLAAAKAVGDDAGAVAGAAQRRQ